MLWNREHGAAPRIFAHRGLTADAFENTLGAFTAAIEAGVFGLEIDVSMTRDGHLVCFHDQDLVRISGVREQLRRTSFGRLRSIPLEGRERVCTLDEALDVIGPDIPLILDVKHAHVMDRHIVEPFRKLMRRRELTTAPSITVSGFNYLTLRGIADALPGLRMAFIAAPDSIHSRIGVSRRLAGRWSAIHPHRSLVSPDSVEKWHERGWTVSAWVVNEADEARRVTQAGVDVIISDDPLAIASAVRPEPTCSP